LISLSSKVSLIILDYWLKRDNAENAVEQLRKEFKNIPIILMSAIRNLPDLKVKLNVEDYLKKPFDIDELSLKVKNILHDTNNNPS
jgi:DNA-binding response OmpR family regulator